MMGNSKAILGPRLETDFKIPGSRVRAGGEPVRDCPALAHDGIRVGISIAEKRLSRNRAYCITA